jgi:hypothetical protein
MCPIFLKGGKTDCTNCRGISLQTHFVYLIKCLESNYGPKLGTRDKKHI